MPKPNQTRITLDEWLNELARCAGSPPDIVPQMFLTRAQFSEHWGISKSRTGERLRNLVKMGKLQMRTYRIERDGKIQQVPHYGPP